MMQIVTCRNITLIAIALVTVHLLMFNDILSKIKSLRTNVTEALRTATPLQSTDSAKFVEDIERWRNYILLKNVPIGVRHWFTYSETESARLSELEADSPALLDYIRKYKVNPPPSSIAVTKDPPKDYSQGGQSIMLKEVLRNKTNGFFIECGALDGILYSNTFLIERQLQWSGLMIEAEPNNFKSLLEKKRNASLVPACLSLSTKPKMLPFLLEHGPISKIESSGNSVQVQCLPIYSILLALNRTTVDLFSLDIEGNELDVLKTIPFDKVDIKVFMVEFNHIKAGKQALIDFMTSKGYITFPSSPAERASGKWAEIDIIFVKKGSGFKETRG